MVHRPAWDHYRCLKFQVPTTGGICVSSQYQLYPQHSGVPIETPRDTSTRVAKDLIKEVKGLQAQEKNHPGRHTQALVTLTKKWTRQQRHSMKGHCAKPKPPLTQQNCVHSMPRHAIINSSHNLTPQYSYRPQSKTQYQRLPRVPNSFRRVYAPPNRQQLRHAAKVQTYAPN